MADPGHGELLLGVSCMDDRTLLNLVLIISVLSFATNALVLDQLRSADGRGEQTIDAPPANVRRASMYNDILQTFQCEAIDRSPKLVSKQMSCNYDWNSCRWNGTNCIQQCRGRRCDPVPHTFHDKFYTCMHAFSSSCSRRPIPYVCAACLAFCEEDEDCFSQCTGKHDKYRVSRCRTYTFGPDMTDFDYMSMFTLTYENCGHDKDCVQNCIDGLDRTELDNIDWRGLEMDRRGGSVPINDTCPWPKSGE